MRVIAINGSPRKKWNTAMVLQKAIEGGASQGAETDLIHLYDLGFKDYSRVVADLFDADTKKKRRKQVFPQDLQKAYDMGVRFATQR